MQELVTRESTELKSAEQPEPANSKRLAFVSWAPFCGRSDNLARLLGGTSHMVYVDSLGSKMSTVWLKYFIQFWQTLKLLFQKRPKTVMVMVPPVFACIPVWLYCKLTGSKYITDTHTAALSMPRWQKLFFLNKWLYRSAATNVITNEHLASLVRSWGAHVTIVGDLPVQFKEIGKKPDSDGFTIAVPCSFNPDEPLANLWEAARRLPDVTFFVTGRIKDLAQEWNDRRPPNLRLTGFLDNASYAALMKWSNVAMVLTTRDHTMQRGAYEAVSMGTPVITSDFPILRETFGGAAEFVDNTPDSIVAAVNRIKGDWDQYKARVETHRQKRFEVWKSRETELRKVLDRD